MLTDVPYTPFDIVPEAIFDGHLIILADEKLFPVADFQPVNSAAV